MAEGNQHPVEGQGAKIRCEQEADGLAKMPRRGGIANGQQKENKQGRHQDSNSPLQAAFQPLGNHKDHQRHKDGVPEQQLTRAGQQATEQLTN